MLCQPTRKESNNSPIFRRRGAAKDFADPRLDKPQRIREYAGGPFRHDIHTDLVRFEMPKAKHAQDVIVGNFVLAQAPQRKFMSRTLALGWHL